MFWKKTNDKSYYLTKKLDKYYKSRRSTQFWEPQNMKWIKNGLLREMSLVSSGEKEKIKVSLYEDNVYNEAKSILLDFNKYHDVFLPIEKEKDNKEAN